MPSVGDKENIRDRVDLKIGTIASSNLQPSDAVLDLCVETGLTHYEGLRPKTVIDDSAGDGSSRRFVLDTLLAEYDPDFSQIKDVFRVTDLDTDDEIINDELGWEIRNSEADGHVLFIGTSIPANEHMRVIYTAHHTIHASDPVQTTVPDVDTDLLTCLAAMYVAYWIARKAGDLAITEMGITEINLRRMREHWADRAKDLANEASEFLSPQLVAVQSAGASVQWPTTSGFTGGRISHRER